MFDIGFSELLVIAVVALLVLGPERLPKAARFAGLWVRKARAQWYSVKSEFEREMASDELKRSLGNPAQDLRDAVKEAGDGLREVRQDLHDTMQEAGALARADHDAATAVQDIPAAAPDPATTDVPPHQPELDDFEFYTEPEPAPDAAPPATDRREPPAP